MRKKTGSIDPTRDGRYRVRITLRGVRKIVGIYDTIAEAEEMRAGAIAVAAEELDEGVTLLEYGKACLERREIGREVRDPWADWSRWEQHIASAPIASVAVPRLRRKHVVAWLRDMQRKGLARQTIVNTMNVLRVIVRSALDEELLREGPFEGIRVTAEKRTVDAWTFLLLDQQATLVAAIPAPERYIVQVAMGTGLRAGELVCLRLEDVGADEIVVRYGTPPNLPTKRGKIRRVPILPVARAGLDGWRAQLGTYTQRGRQDYGNPHGLLFPRRMGTFRDPDHVLRWDMWDSARKAIGWEGCWHDLRHTCAASLVRGWWGRRWSLEEVCAMLGHASLTTTERYAHLADDILAEAARGTAIGLESVQAARAALEKKRMKPTTYPRQESDLGLRFRKPPATYQEPDTYVTRDRLATGLLRAIADGDPRALSMAVELAESVLVDRDLKPGNVASGDS